MKLSEIVVGGIYMGDDRSRRKVLDMTALSVLYHEPFIGYKTCSRWAFARWAKERVG